MKNQGFAVGPGAHTLVGVKQYRVNYFVLSFSLFYEIPLIYSRSFANASYDSFLFKIFAGHVLFM